MDWSCIVLGRQDVIVRNACRAEVTETDIMFNIISLHSALSRGGILISLGLSFMARCTVLLYLESEQFTGTAVFFDGFVKRFWQKSGGF